MAKRYQIVDGNGEPFAETLFKSEREAYKAKEVYLDHCDDFVWPLKVVPVEIVEKSTQDFQQRD